MSTCLWMHREHMITELLEYLVIMDTRETVLLGDKLEKREGKLFKKASMRFDRSQKFSQSRFKQVCMPFRKHV